MPSQGIDNKLGFLRYWKRGLRQVPENVTDKQTEFGPVGQAWDEYSRVM